MTKHTRPARNIKRANLYWKKNCCAWCARYLDACRGVRLLSRDIDDVACCFTCKTPGRRSEDYTCEGLILIVSVFFVILSWRNVYGVGWSTAYLMRKEFTADLEQSVDLIPMHSRSLAFQNTP